MRTFSRQLLTRTGFEKSAPSTHVDMADQTILIGVVHSQSQLHTPSSVRPASPSRPRHATVQATKPVHTYETGSAASSTTTMPADFGADQDRIRRLLRCFSGIAIAVLVVVAVLVLCAHWRPPRPRGCPSRSPSSRASTRRRTSPGQRWTRSSTSPSASPRGAS